METELRELKSKQIDLQKFTAPSSNRGQGQRSYLSNSRYQRGRGNFDRGHNRGRGQFSGNKSSEVKKVSLNGR